MTDKRKQDLMDQYDEITFALMMDRYAEEEGALLLREFEKAMASNEVPEVPAPLDRRCRDIIRREYARQSRKTKWKRFQKSAAIAAVVLLAFLGLASATIFSVDALRIPFLNFWVSHFETNSVLHFPEDPTVPANLADIIPNLMPSGYQSVYFEERTGGLLSSVYQNPAGELIYFDAEFAVGTYSFNTEDSITEEITLLDYSATLVEKDDYRMVWIDESKGILYSIRATEFNKEDFVAFCLALAEALQ